MEKTFLPVKDLNKWWKLIFPSESESESAPLLSHTCGYLLQQQKDSSAFKKQ